MANRRTLAAKVSARGVTLHTGVPAEMILSSAPSGAGIIFRRTDLAGTAAIPALWSAVGETRLGTVLCGADGASIGMVEHLLAALAGADIDDCMIEVDGPEPPVLDGDALSYLVLIEEAGTETQPGMRPVIEVLKPVEAVSGPAGVRLSPAPRADYSVEIDFASHAIGRQSLACVLSPKNFRREIAPARTFGFLKDAERLRAAGYGRGADLTNTLVLDEDALMNPEISRFSDEFVRHKILDAIGDLKLAGAPLRARYEGRRPSHTLNNQLLRALFADSGNYRLAES